MLENKKELAKMDLDELAQEIGDLQTSLQTELSSREQVEYKLAEIDDGMDRIKLKINELRTDLNKRKIERNTYREAQIKSKNNCMQLMIQIKKATTIYHTKRI